MADRRADDQGRWGQPLPQRIAILRALQLGDLLCAVPALRALRAALPHSRIVLIGLPWARGFVERFSSYLDGFLEFPGYPGLPERPPLLRQVPTFLRAAQEERFDLAIQMHGSGEVVNPLAALLGARATAGFFLPGQFCPDPERFLVYPEGEPEVMRLLKLVEFLGAPARGEELEFPLCQGDREELQRAAGMADLIPFEYACLHPGARNPTRRWEPERFARVGDALAARGLRVVLTGSAEESSLAWAVGRAMEHRPLDLSGRTSLGALAALLEGARILVSNDTGVSHLAAALGVQSVVVFTASDPARWAPLSTRRHRAVHHPVDCRPCWHQVCPIGHPCSRLLESEEVIREVEELLGKGPPRGSAGHGRRRGTTGPGAVSREPAA